MKLLAIAAGIGVLASAAFAQPAPEVVGGVSSTAPIEIDGTAMAPSPSWPVVNRDVIRSTSSPGLLLTQDQNRVTLLPATTVRVRTIQPHQTWIFVREGGVSVNTKNNDLLICIANRVFQPAAAVNGTLVLEKSGTVTRAVAKGLLREVPVRACGEELASGLILSTAGAVAGGTAGAAAAGAATASAGAAGAIAGGAIAAAATVGLATASGLATSASTCTSSAGCNFNPPPITPSTP